MIKHDIKKRLIKLLLVAIPTYFLRGWLIACSSDVYAHKLITAIDSLGNIISFDEQPKNVVVLQSSLGSAWMLAGGTISGISNDYLDYGLSLGEATIIGTTKSPNLEKIVASLPDFVIYSDKIDGQKNVAEKLSERNITTFAAHIDSFEDYLYVLSQFCLITNRSDLYNENGLKIQSNIKNIINSVPDTPQKVMFIRAYSTGFNVLSSGNIVCDMLDDLNCINIAKENTSLAQELSMEIVLRENPKYIFIVYMGSKDEEKTQAYLESSLFSNEYWNKLDAVKSNKVFTLPTNLFHYKPNNNWDKSYQYLYEILYSI